MSDPLSTLNWLVEAGAGEAIGDEPVNRLVAKAPLPNPPLEGGSKFALQLSERGPRAAPSKRPLPELLRNSTFPQGGGRTRSATPILNSDTIGTGMELAGAATSLAELRAAMEGFEGCPLKRTATNTVFADGVPGNVMFIGEAPGRDEDRLGKPFVGRAGQLLDRMMASIGLDRRTNAYITNVIAWRPPDNRDPSPEEAAQCLPFLRRHVELAQPRLIILLGAVAARHVVGISDGIMKLRGRWLEYRVGDHMVPLLPTLHPAYLLRQPAHKKLAWRDLQAAQAKLESLG